MNDEIHESPETYFVWFVFFVVKNIFRNDWV